MAANETTSSISSQRNNSYHPRAFIGEVASCFPDLSSFELSVYTHRPVAVSDRREVFEVGRECLEDSYRQIEENLSLGQEIAFNSRCYFGRAKPRRVRHLLLADFKCSDLKGQIDDILRFAREWEATRIALYSSGRSYHLYGDLLVPEERWPALMGRLILLNLPSQSEIVDTRWVGHRLLGGYAALRWSANSPQHQEKPRLVLRKDLA